MIGATAVRFVFGLPFAVLFLLAAGGTGLLARLDAVGWIWAGAGALSQIAATALLLSVMEMRGFGVATALIKTEPASLILIAWAALGEAPGAARLLAIAVAVAGVLLTAAVDWRHAAPRAMGAGVVSGALFGASAIAFRQAIFGLGSGSDLQRAGAVLVAVLALQSALFVLWLTATGPGRHAAAVIRRDLRASAGAGLLGAVASQFWFLAFAMTPAANVRTLALIEIPFAIIVSRRFLAEVLNLRQYLGMGLVIIGVALLLRAA